MSEEILFEGAKDVRDISRGMQEIIPDLYLGGRQDAEEIDEGFALVVNCTPDIPQSERKGVEKVRMPIPDSHGKEENSAMAKYLPRVVEVIIETLRGGNGKVLVHCEAGRSRSASVIVAVLVRYRRYSLEDSKLLVRSKCPDALKRDGFKEALEEYSRAGEGPAFCLSDVMP